MEKRVFPLHRIAFLRTLLLLFVAGMLFPATLQANNVRIIGTPKLDQQDTAKNTIQIKFDIAWDNSWKTTKPENNDAVWIFVKCWDGETWNHVYLEDTKGSYVAGSSSAADAVNKGLTYYVSDREGKNTKQPMELKPGYSYAWKKWRLDPKEDSVKCVVGFFLQRQDYGAGHVVVPGVRFTWNYGNQGFVDGDDLVVKVFAIEMVYIPQGPYYLGGKGTAAWQTGSFTTNGATFGTPMVITSENEIQVANTTAANTLWAANSAITAGVIPKDFPKGYQAFYIMKYEMTQQAYCEFLNTLSQGQQDGRIEGTLDKLTVNSWAFGADIKHFRNYIKLKQAAPVAIFGCDGNLNNKYDETDRVAYRPGDTLTRNIDGQDLAVTFVSLYDLLAYAEFAGLRPMTELEYEKACRGPRAPANDEYAWGSVTMVFFGKAFHAGAGAYTSNNANLIDAKTGTERVADSYNVGYTRGYTYTRSGSYYYHYYYPAPLRVGLFADSTSTRASAGATYWGVMNMSDNPAEICISAVDATGRKFTGVHGCGQLDGNGNATCAGWHMTTAARYYISRGMHFYYYGSSRIYGLSNRFDVDEAYYGGTQGANGWYWAGMISSRHMWNHAVAGTTRNFGANTTSPMIGIRCVRTDNAER